MINSFSLFLHSFYLELKAELERRYSTLEQLQKTGAKYDQHTVDKELETLEKLQQKYNKLEMKRKRQAKQTYEKVGDNEQELFDEIELKVLLFFAARSIAVLIHPDFYQQHGYYILCIKLFAWHLTVHTS